MKITIKKNCSLLEGVRSLQPVLSNSTCKNWIKMGRIEVNGFQKKDLRFELRSGDILALTAKKTQLYPGVEILYEDPDCVIVTKPAGLLAVDSLDPEELSLHQILKAYAKPDLVYPVQRLDEGTSGVMIYALNRSFKDALKEQFEKHTIIREYHALVHGVPNPKKGTWKNRLKETKQYFVHVVDSGGDQAITHYNLIDSQGPYSFINFRLETGRKNQIRVQSSHFGYPIVGDTKYGIETDSFYRLALHAHTLGFYHPKLQKNLSFHVKTPFSLSHLTHHEKTI